MATRKIIKLKNGATLIYSKKKYNNATALQAGFFCGHEYAKNGIPHLLEHMLFNGTKKRSHEDIIEDRTNIGFLNAYTNDNVVCATIFQSNKRVEECFEYLSDVLLNSKFNQEHLNNEVNVVLEEKAKLYNRHLKSVSTMHDLYIKKSNVSLKYEMDRVIGKEDFLKSLTINDLEEFRKEHFVCNKFFVSVATSLSLSKIKKLVNKYLIGKINNINDKNKMPHNNVLIDQEEGLNFVKNEDSTFKVLVSLTANTPNNNYRFDFNLDCLCSRMQLSKSLFHTKVRDAGLAYSSQVLTHYNDFGDNMWVGFAFETSKIENIAKIISIFGDCIKALKKDGLTQEEIDLFIENYFLSKDKKMPAEYKEIAHDNISKYIRYGNEKLVKRKFIDQCYKNITTKSINENINKFFDEKNPLHITILGNAEEKDFLSISEYKDLLFSKK